MNGKTQGSSTCVDRGYEIIPYVGHRRLCVRQRSGKNVRSVVRRGTVTSWTRGIVVAFTLLHARHEREIYSPTDAGVAPRCALHRCPLLRVIAATHSTDRYSENSHDCKNPRFFVANRESRCPTFLPEQRYVST